MLDRDLSARSLISFKPSLSMNGYCGWTAMAEDDCPILHICAYAAWGLHHGLIASIINPEKYI